MLSGLVILLTSPQGKFLPSLPLSPGFSLLVLLPEETDEPQLFSAMQESISKPFIYGKKPLKGYQSRECCSLSLHLPQTEEYHREAEKA